MIARIASTARSLKQAIGRRAPKRRDDSGLTTLEWLLIVAAVAGLAALAVVLVQNVVSETGEQIAGSSARKTAAKVAASTVEQEAKNATVSRFKPGTTTDAQAWVNWENYFTEKCERIEITFSDADVEISAAFDDPNTAGVFTVAFLTAATEAASAAAGDPAQAMCNAS